MEANSYGHESEKLPAYTTLRPRSGRGATKCFCVSATRTRAPGEEGLQRRVYRHNGIMTCIGGHFQNHRIAQIIEIFANLDTSKNELGMEGTNR
jgi:hypothetical protein